MLTHLSMLSALAPQPPDVVSTGNFPLHSKVHADVTRDKVHTISGKDIIGALVHQNGLVKPPLHPIVTLMKRSKSKVFIFFHSVAPHLGTYVGALLGDDSPHEHGDNASNQDHQVEGEDEEAPDEQGEYMRIPPVHSTD